MQPEGVDLEYKKSKNSLPKDFWPTYSAFANTHGGLIVLGVEEPEKGSFVIEGVQSPTKVMAELTSLVTNPKKVSACLISDEDVVIRSVNHKTVIEVRVRQADYYQKPVFLNGSRDSCYVRLGDGDKRPSAEQYKYMVANSQQYVDTELLENYTIDDLDLNSLEEYRNLMIKNTARNELSSLSPQDFLEHLGCFQIDRRDAKQSQKMTTGCLLFFGKFNAIIQRFPGFQLDYFRKNSSYDEKWIRRISTGDMNYPELNIFSFYVLVLKALTDDISDRFTQASDLTRGPYYSHMKLAVKEALVNTLMHAYYDSDTPIKIFDYDDYYEFFNPGDMRVTKEEFIHGSNSVSRNSIISLLLRRVGIAEKAGSGGPTIFNAAQANHLRTPDIIRTNDSTTLRIWKIDLLSSLKGLTHDQVTVVTYAMENSSKVSIKGLLKTTNLSEFKARKAVKELIENKILHQYGNGKATRYFLNTNEETGILGYKMMLKKFEDQFNK